MGATDGTKYDKAADDALAGTGSDTSNGVKNVVLLPTGPRQGYYSAGRGGYTDPALQPYTETQASDYYVSMTDAERKRLNSEFNRVGKRLGYESPRSYWGALVTASINKGVTPWDISKQQGGKGPGPSGTDPKGSGPSGGSGAYTGPTSRVDLTNEFDAEALLNDALGNYLGRSATPKELANFKKLLNKTEAANPRVNTPVGQAMAVGSGGVNQQQVAEDFAKSRGNYAETQADTTLMSWMTEALTNKNRMV